MILNVVFALFGVGGLAYAAVLYRELHRWARQCQNARIVIAHKQRVKLDAPLTDWLTWANMLDKDEASTGRIVYRIGHASVAIVRPTVAIGIRAGIRRARNARKARKAG